MCPAPRFEPKEQEQLILDAAAKVINESSLLNFKMSSIAKAAGMSMGSIYKHVQVKEDVLVALTVSFLHNRLDYFKPFFNLKLTTPEKLLGVHLSNRDKLDLYPFERPLEHLIANDAILHKSSPGWIAKLNQINQQIDNQFRTLLRDACESGELIAEGDTLVELEYGLWALAVGNDHIQRHTESERVGTHTMHEIQVNNVVRFINCFQWADPLDRESLKRVHMNLETLDMA